MQLDFEDPRAKCATLADLFGMDEAKQWALELAKDLADFHNGWIPWSDLDHACVLHGPPGTGKTMFARILANTFKWRLVATSFGEWQSSGDGHLGHCQAAISAAFERARGEAPCIFFIDELDSLPKRRSGGGHPDYWNAVVNHILKELDSLAELEKVIVIGACNHPEKLDPALIRAGRLDRMIEVTPPSLEELPKVIRFHLRKDELPFADLRPLSRLCVGMTGAEIEQAVRDARRLARRGRRVFDAEAFRDVVTAGAKKLSPADLRRVAIHEAGHAVASIRLRPRDDVSIAITGRKGAAGAAHRDAAPELVTHKSMEAIISITLAGRAAEEILLGVVSAGAGGDETSDLASASHLAVRGIGQFGLAKRDLALWAETAEAGQVRFAPHDVALEARVLLNTLYLRVRTLIEEEKAFVQAVADRLIEASALGKIEIIALDPRRRIPLRRRLPDRFGT